MSERWYLQQGYSITNERLKTGACKPKRRLKADYVTAINDLMQTSIKSLVNMTVVDLKTLEERLMEKKDA